MKALALLSHENKKTDLVACANFNRETLKYFRLAATATTGRLLKEQVGLAVDTVLSDPHGDDVQIAAEVGSGTIDAVFFFVDPLSAQPHDPDIQALIRPCSVHNIPLATNLVTADLLIAAMTAIGNPQMAAG